ncbi:MAG TPA: efflux transporter periplasmic adaptor subunit, partial [bacterium]|nr:efflux transporter periplasmic adaptor subunit [bacterium]
FVAYVVNAKDRVEVRPVGLAGISDGMQAVTKGVSEGERVIVEGLQKVKDGMKVNPQKKK